MKALILAAGYGTRLKPLTLKIPKPLIPVFGRPIIEYAINRLKAFGVKDVVVNNHWHGDAIMKYLGDGSRLGVRLRHSPEKTILGSGGAVGGAAGLLKGGEFFLLYNGDVFTDVDLSSAIETHAAKKNAVTMVLIDREEYNQVAVDHDGNVITIQRQRPQNEDQDKKYLAYTGISIINTSLLPEFPVDREEDLIRIYLRLIKKGVKVGSHFVEGCFWEDMGSLPAYLHLHRRLHEKGHISFVSSSARMATSATFKGFYSVGDGAVIGEECRVEDSVILPGSTLGKGASLSNCVYFEDRVVYKAGT